MKYDIEVIIPIHPSVTCTFPMTLNLEMSREDVLELMFGWFNAGSGSECVMFLEKKCRSLSVNDFVKINGEYFQCRSTEWEMVSEGFMINQLNDAHNMCNDRNISMWHALLLINRRDACFDDED